MRPAHSTDEVELPAGWKWSSLADCAKIIAGQSPPSDTYNTSGNGLPFFQGKAEFGDLHPTVRKWCSSPSKVAEAGDILFSVRAPVGPTNVATERCGIGRGLAAIRANDGIDPMWLLWWLRFSEKRISARGTGTTFAAITGPMLSEERLPVPPFDQQRRIVARIEELFGEIEAGEQELAAAQADLGCYRRAVLKAAVTGELTRDWREQNPPNETGADLLARILQERRARWEDAERAKFAAKGQTPKDDTWKSRYPEPVAPNTADLPKLPDGWAWATMAQVTLLTGGLTVDAKREGDELVEVPYLRVANVQRGALDLSVMKTIRAPQDRINALRLLSNDVLLNEGGDRDKVGRGWVWEGQISDCIHQNHVFRARPIVPELDGRFISHYCNEVGREYFLRESKQTTNLASLSMSKVASLAIPIPPSAEIVAIVSIAAQALESCGELLSAVGGSTREATSLRQSILAAAFNGKLVADAAPATNKSKRRHVA